MSDLKKRWNIPFSAVGIAIGAAIGIANHNVGLGVGLAIIFGLAVGRKRQNRQDNKDLLDMDE
jgi:hypothetical protein